MRVADGAMAHRGSGVGGGRQASWVAQWVTVGPGAEWQQARPVAHHRPAPVRCREAGQARSSVLELFPISPGSGNC